MEEIRSLKREREETKGGKEEEKEALIKRQKSYKDIIIDTLLLEEEDDNNEDEPSQSQSQDLSSLISTLQEEIEISSSSPYGPAQPAYCKPDHFSNGPGSGSGSEEEEEEEEKESSVSVMKHLLQASDDELGLPNTNTNTNIIADGFDELVGGRQVDGGDYLFDGEGLWEFEDHELAANYNYYSFLQSSSQIFL